VNNLVKYFSFLLGICQVTREKIAQAARFKVKRAA